MTDPFGRTISYLRVSVTDRCDLRCFYCMSEDMTFLPKKDLLTLEELDRLCSAFVAKGVRKIRLTGGEPLVRRNVMSLVRSLSRHLSSGALDELTLTTNASQLARFASELRDLGYAHQRLAGYPDPRNSASPAGAIRQGAGRHRRGAPRAWRSRSTPWR
jgi:cyclic pyranopterin phosphate synthase